jgi:hypothetical protein
MKVSQRNAFHFLVGIILRHPFGVLLVGVLGVILSLLLTGTHLGFHTNRLDLISAGVHEPARGRDRRHPEREPGDG